VSRARWAQGYATGWVSKGGWGPTDGAEEAGDEVAGPGEEAASRLHVVQRMVREVKGLEQHLATLHRLARRQHGGGEHDGDEEERRDSKAMRGWSSAVKVNGNGQQASIRDVLIRKAARERGEDEDCAEEGILLI
jgi:hypothetical protein